MIFVWIKESDKNSQIFAIWMHSQFIERDNDVQSSQIFAFLYSSESLVDQWQRIAISFDQSIELSIINAETQAIVFLFDEQDERDVWSEARENELFVQMFDQILLYLLKLFDRTSDTVCFERTFSDRSTQSCDRRNDEMIADWSLFDRTCLDSRDIQRRAWLWLARESWRVKAHVDSLLQTCFRL